ncbi:MAG TPA: DUF1704 domain-containing protein [Candidatus Absconditabacterales bacterium]|nr:DUF1704 domain-containing protein [Candidatus Absconditabacterales bacterium]
MFTFGILGLNARNLNYIKKFNPKKTIRLADNKARTKDFLSARDIPVPKTFGRIMNHHDLMNYDFSELEQEEFVIKPNKGSKGRGISIVSFRKNSHDTISPKSFGFFDKLLYGSYSFFDHTYTIGGVDYDDLSFKKKLIAILDGAYSLGVGSDTILIEEKLIPGEGFEKFCSYGLADMRIIVFNLVPIAAMVRVPTIHSGGKANLAQGGIGLGIEIGSGKITSMQLDGVLYDENFPEEHKHYRNKKIPFWDEILLHSSRIQFFTNMGYLALDWVITEKGPKLLEVNARAGLEIQKISLTPLENVLAKISDLSIQTPEKGVSIGKSLFHGSHQNISEQAKTIFLSQKGTLVSQKDGIKKEQPVIIRLNLTKRKNYVSSKVMQGKVPENFSYTLVLPDSEAKIKDLQLAVDPSLKKNTIILGQRSLSSFVIKPEHKFYYASEFLTEDAIISDELSDLQSLDQILGSYNKYINLGRILRPLNLLDEFDTFITKHGNYNPQFSYKFPEIDFLDKLTFQHEDLFKKFFEIKKLKSRFATLFREKILYNIEKIKLIRAYVLQDFDAIAHYNTFFFHPFNEQVLHLCREKCDTLPLLERKKLGKQLHLEDIKKIISTHLTKNHLTGVKIKVVSSRSSRISVGFGRQATIKLLAHLRLREKELNALIAHEIDCHLMRYQKGQRLGRNILKTGTAHYIFDEEGLAIFQANKIYQTAIPGYENSNIYKHHIQLFSAQQTNFSGMVENLLDNQTHTTSLKLKNTFKSIFRLKRGIIDTGVIHSGSVFMKDKVYLDGYLKIKKWVDQGGDIDDLMLGKIKIEDFPYL